MTATRPQNTTLVRVTAIAAGLLGGVLLVLAIWYALYARVFDSLFWPTNGNEVGILLFNRLVPVAVVGVAPTAIAIGIVVSAGLMLRGSLRAAERLQFLLGLVLFGFSLVLFIALFGGIVGYVGYTVVATIGLLAFGVVAILTLRSRRRMRRV